MLPIQSIYPLIMILLALMYMIFQRHHLLMALLFLEMMIVSLTVFLVLNLSPMNWFFLLILLTFGACEASMGLALLISMTRSYGVDMISSLTLNKC